MKNLLQTLIWGDTKPTRFFLALLDFAFASYLYTPDSIDDTLIMMTSIPSGDPHLLWSALLVLHGCAMLNGLRGVYNIWTLMLEGVLGVGVWGIVAITNTVEQGYVPGPSSVALMMMMWLLMRLTATLKSH